MKDREIGQIFVESNLITKAQLENLLFRQKDAQKSFLKLLINEEVVSEGKIFEIIQTKFGIPYIYLSSIDFSREVIKLIPEDILRSYKLFPYKLEDDIIFLAMVDPLDTTVINDIQLLTGRNIKPAIASETDIERSLAKYYALNQVVKTAIDKLEYKSGDIDRLVYNIDPQTLGNDAPVNAILNGIIEQAIQANASDIHIEPAENSLKIRFRVDGILQEVYNFPRKVLFPLISRIKLMSEMDIAEKRLPQDGRFQTTVGTKQIDIRASSLPIIFGEKLVMRLLDKEQKMIDINELGFSLEQLEAFRRLLRFPHGMILVTGPTGSGKTTTLYAALKYIQSSDKNIVTIENPVEYILAGVNQVQINYKAGMTFNTGLRSIMRQDPDIIMVGEIRDRETAEIGVRAATTGHLVFSTLHTNDAASALTRLLDMGVEAFLVASSVIGVVAQRLVRRVCPKCSLSYILEPNTPESLFLGDSNTRKEIILYRGKGCSYCNYTGFKGRIAIQEILQITSEERKLILNKADTSTIHQTAVRKGMQTMKEDGIRKALSGITTIDEIIRVSYGGEY